MKNACTTFCTHEAVQNEFKRLNISNGREISLNFLQNRRNIAVCVYLGLFRLWKRRALRSALMTQCKVRLNVEESQRGEKYRLIFYKIDELLQFACIWACFDVGGQVCPTFCTHNTEKRAFKRRSISNGREISLNFLQNRWIIAICVYLGLLRRRKTRAQRSARIMQWKERLNVEVSRTGEKYRIMFYKIDELLQFACIWTCFYDEKGVHYVLHA